MSEKDPNGIDAHAPGAKLDEGKAEYSVVLRSFPLALAEVNAVGCYGAEKYSLDGWQSVPSGEPRYLEAMLRHTVADCTGEKLDPSSGLYHAAQTAWNSLARLELILRRERKNADN